MFRVGLNPRCPKWPMKALKQWESNDLAAHVDAVARGDQMTWWLRRFSFPPRRHSLRCPKTLPPPAPPHSNRNRVSSCSSFSFRLPQHKSQRNPRGPRATWRTARARRLVWRRSSRGSQRAATGRILRRRVRAERSRSSRRSRDILAFLSLEPVGLPWYFCS